MFEKLENILETNFEKTLLIEAINNLKSDSKLRFSNFAYVIRELLTRFLERKAPNEYVLKCQWYNKPDGDMIVVRSQRIRYIISGGLPDEFFDQNIVRDISEINKYINELSKYVHITKEILTLSAEAIEQTKDEFAEIVDSFVCKIEYAKNRIINLLEQNIYNIITENNKVLSELDCLSTHTRIEDVSLQKIEIINIDYSTIECNANVLVEVELQYGSDGDVRRGDAIVMNSSYPVEFQSSIFIPNCTLDKKELEQFLLESFKENAQITIDTSSFY